MLFFQTISDVFFLYEKQAQIGLLKVIGIQINVCLFLYFTKYYDDINTNNHHQYTLYFFSLIHQ